jgi:hypothetical protein
MSAANAAVTPSQSMPKYLGRPIPANTSLYPPGIPAIQPHLVTSHSSVSGSGSFPAFAATDAAQYVTSHPFWHTNIQVAGSFNVMHVTFLTSHALSIQLHGESIGRPDTALVCYVELQGTFIFAGAKGPMTAHEAYEVFDAQTGSLILTGGQVR